MAELVDQVYINSKGRKVKFPPDCKPDSVLGFDTSEDALEQPFAYGLRVWHAIFLGAAAVLAFVVLICCCIKFRIPRTKQEIEGDYIRRKILKKFRQRLKAIQNQELDEMDLKRALDKIRAEFKSDTESLAQSEALSVGTLSSGAFGGPNSSTYRRASQIAMDISIEDLRAHSSGLQGRVRLALLKCCRRSKPSRVCQAEPKIIPIDTTVQPQSSKNNQQPIPAVSIIDETCKPKLKPKPSVKPRSQADGGGQKEVKEGTSQVKTIPSSSDKEKPNKDKKLEKTKKDSKEPNPVKSTRKDSKTAAREEKAKEKAAQKEKKEQRKELQKQEKSAKQQSAKEAKQKKKEGKKEPEKK